MTMIIISISIFNVVVYVYFVTANEVLAIENKLLVKVSSEPDFTSFNIYALKLIIDEKNCGELASAYNSIWLNTETNQLEYENLFLEKYEKDCVKQLSCDELRFENKFGSTIAFFGLELAEYLSRCQDHINKYPFS